MPFSEREKKLIEIIGQVRKDLDINSIEKAFVKTIGEYLDADVVYFFTYDSKNDRLNPVDKFSEYRKTPDLPSLIGTDMEQYKFFRKLGKSREIIIFDNVKNDLIEKNNLQGSPEEIFVDDYGIKSAIIAPMYYKEQYLGLLNANYRKKHTIAISDINFLEIIRLEAGNAIYEANLYKDQKVTAEREKILREFIGYIREYINVDEIKKKIVNFLGREFNMERCFIVEADPVTKKIIPLKENDEYRSSEEVRSVVGFDFNKEELAVFTEIAKNDIDAYGKSAADFLLMFKDKITPAVLDYFEKIEINNGFQVALFYMGDFLGVLSGHYRKAGLEYTEGEKKFIKTLANQAAIAIKQAQLYEKQKQAVERERLLREITGTIRSTLEANKIKQKIVELTCKALNADRCLIADFDSETNEFLPVKFECIGNPEAKSLKGFEPEKEIPEISNIIRRKEELLAFDIEEYIKERGLENSTSFLKGYNKMKVKSDIAIPIVFMDKLYGTFVLNYIKEKVFLDEDKLNFIRVLAYQTAIALNQAELYESVKKTAEREAILRNILGEIKRSQSLDEAYNYILAKMANIFDVDRSVFLEISRNILEKTYVKYEHLKNQNIPSMQGHLVPESCINIFKETSEHLKPFIIDDLIEHHKYDEESLNVIKKLCIRSIMAVPFVRYNRDVKLLGIFALCSSQKRSWTKEDLQLLESVAKNVINVVWDITKLKEIEEIRNTYMLTLAHDLMVPVVGEQKALEYINSQSDDTQIIEIKKILEGLLENNQAINETLSKLIEIYNYEMGNKNFEFALYSPEELMQNTCKKLKEQSKSKGVKFNWVIKESMPSIRAAKKEIEKVFGFVLENAIEYSPENEQVEIKFKKLSDKYITVCISDKGPGFPLEYEEKVFNRYEMIKLLGRKIGSGLSLYLAKLIIEAHNGLIKIISKPGEGTTFCMYFPMEY